MDEFLAYVDNLDTRLLLLLNHSHCAAADYIMCKATSRYIWIPFYILLAFIAYRRRGLTACVIIVLTTVTAVGLADFVCAALIRPEVARLRPTNIFNPIYPLVTKIEGYVRGGYGFPSCHAANTFALATFYSLVMKRAGITIMMLAFAILVSYSRIYLGVHYPGDIIVGAAIGSALAAGLYWLYGRLSRRYPLLRVLRN